MADDSDDPFWDPPSSTDDQAASEEVAGLTAPGRSVRSGK
jgi:hypothetical protein